jgi:uncharacterized protein (UPF0332 family)
MAQIYLHRAENEIVAAEKLKEMSDDEKVRGFMQIPSNMTFYSGVLTHAYYAIFYAAKAILLTKGIDTKSPEVHKKTLEAFRRELVETGMLDVGLFEIYSKMVVRADELLEVFREEKRKRGEFTYKTIPQANIEPAEDSVKNAIFFVSNIRKVMM